MSEDPEESEEEQINDPAQPEGDAPLIDLPSGKELDDNGARTITIARPNRLVVVAGPASCGKTTLLISLYELFQWGAVPGWLFSGCATFRGFELRCHPSRVASERVRAHTDRTINNDDEVRYLHLQICPADDPKIPLDLLFTDVAGELFERARDSTADCQQLKFVDRADHFVLLLDGEKLASASRRHSAIHEGEMLLRSCLDSGALHSHSYVEVLFAKCDHFAIAPEPATMKELCDQVKNDFQERFAHRVARLLFAEVAARPEPDRNLKFGHGLPELLSRWASSSPRTRPLHLASPAGRGQREIDAFLKRHFDSAR